MIDPARSRLEAALTGDQPRVITVAVPPDPDRWRRAWATGAPHARLWCPPEGRRLWSLGEVQSLPPDSAWGTVQEALGAWAPAGDPAPPLPLLVALPFDAAQPLVSPWTALGPAALLLPRWLGEERGDQAWIRVLVRHPEAERDALLAEWDRLCGPAAPPSRPTAPPEAEPGDRAAWTRQIEAPLAEIAAGRLVKQVVARQARYRLPQPVADHDALAALISAHPDCAVFGLRHGGSTFLGATPERLLLKAGARVRSDALAGTGSDEAALRESAKDRLEHQLVVDAIAAALGPACAWLRWPGEPEVVRLRYLCHLRTRFEGAALPDHSPLDLARALNPTPAVGGAPRDLALAQIAQEPAPRGLYAGPVGWVDEAGDGELWIALRSGVLRGKELLLYAGVGVVAGSEPAAEWAETERKLRTLEAAFSP